MWSHDLNTFPRRKDSAAQAEHYQRESSRPTSMSAVATAPAFWCTTLFLACSMYDKRDIPTHDTSPYERDPFQGKELSTTSEMGPRQYNTPTNGPDVGPTGYGNAQRTKQRRKKENKKKTCLKKQRAQKNTRTRNWNGQHEEKRENHTKERER